MKSHRRIPAIIASIALAGGMLFSASSPAMAVPASCSGFDSSSQSTTTGLLSCTVPAGMTSATVTLVGAGGGGGRSSGTSTGGHGAQVVTTITLIPGEVLSLEVGTGGAGAAVNTIRGGGGGGFTAIFRGNTPLVIAGAGGGGGSASDPTLTSYVYAGGNGGTPNGTGGLPAVSINDGATSRSGGGATTTAGGVRGTSSGSNNSAYGQTGVLYSDSTVDPNYPGTGGYGGTACDSGPKSKGGNRWVGGVSDGTCIRATFYQGSSGGGGAGYYGGGGGGGAEQSATTYKYGLNGSGGGGSSFDSAGVATFSLASNGGAMGTAGGSGSVLFSVYTPPAQSTLTLTPGFVVGDLAPNAPVSLSGSDLQPSSAWSSDIRSTPVVFASGTTDGSGNFSLGSNLPSNVGPGEHTITLYGTSSSGAAWTRVVYITVGENLRVTYMSTSAAEGNLANTGQDTLGMTIGAFLLLGVGVLLMNTTIRRRKAAK